MLQLSSKITEVIANIQAELNKSPLYFLVPESERALGLEDVLGNYFSISASTDAVSHYILNQHKGIVIESSKGAASILASEKFLNFVKSININNSCYIQFFKNTDDDAFVEFATKGIESKILNNSASITRELENKIKQYELLVSVIPENLPLTEITNLGKLNISTLKEKFSHLFTIQMPFGHTGSSTILITDSKDSETEMEKLNLLISKIPNRECKVAKYIVGHTFTINACNYRDKTYVAGLSYQYTGISGLTDVKAATVGNDWDLPEALLSSEQIQEIVNLTQKVGRAIFEHKGFRGLFGLDIIVEKLTGKIFLLELNPRQTASISIHTKLQLLNDQTPLSLINLCEFLNIDFSENVDVYSAVGVKKIPAAQLVMRSLTDEDYLLPQTILKSGIYRQLSDNSAREIIAEGGGDNVIFLDSAQDRPLIWQNEGYTISDFNQNGFLLLIKPAGTNISYNEEIARVQFNRGLYIMLGDEVKILPLVKDAFARLRIMLDQS